MHLDCIADFMIRTNAADQFYTSDLLFDQDELTEQIKPFIEQYKEMYE